MQRSTRSQVRGTAEELIEADLEVERALQRRVRENRQREAEGAEKMEEIQQRIQPNVQPRITLKDRNRPNILDYRSSIAEPEVNIPNFELKPELIRMIQQSQFGGGINENPNVHLTKFLQLCNTLKTNGVPEVAIRLRLFPFSLRDRASEWLMSMPPNSFTDWETLANAFLARYFPPAKTAKIRKEINNFCQRDGETLYEAWERLKDLQRQCPHHGVPQWLIVENFYNGVDQSVRSSIDSAAGGSLMNKTDDEAYELIEELAMHNYQYGNIRGTSRKSAVYETESLSVLSAKIDQLSMKFDSMNMNSVASTSLHCEVCGGGHLANECPMLTQEGQNQQFSQPEEPGMRELLEKIIMKQQKDGDELKHQMQQMNQRMSGMSNEIEQLRAHNKIIDNQIAQQVAGPSQWSYDKLPSQTEVNPRGEVHAITLRSGKQVETQTKEPTLDLDKGENMDSQTEEKAEEEKPYVPPPPYKPPLPFPQRVQKKNVEKQFGKFLSTLKTLSINIPLIEAITQMPSYAKFLKEILTKKRKLEEYATVSLAEESSAIMQNKLPPKLKDPGSFSIPCLIGKIQINRALCDLGASVSLIPLSICRKLKLGDPKPTTMSLQLADRSIRKPVGIIEDVPVQIGNLFIPVDFVVLEMEENMEIPVILGRPFLATTGALIDVKKGQLTFEVGDDKVEFNFPAMESNQVEVYETGQHEELKSITLHDITPPLLHSNKHNSENCATSSMSKEKASQVKSKPLYSKYQKFCQVPGTLQQKTRWALRFCKPDLKADADKRHLRLNE